MENKKIENLLPGLQKNVLLKNYTTFRIGGQAKYFFAAKSKEDLIKAAQVAKKIKLPFFVLGSGSNILVSDKLFSGLVIKCQMSQHQNHDTTTSLRASQSKFGAGQANVKCQMSKLYTEAGAPLSLLVNQSIKQNLAGLEWAAGIPGTVGGAVYGNAGSFGKSMKDIVGKVEIFDIKAGKSKIFKNKDCKFGYRDSIFKKKKNLIILSATFQLKKGNKNKIKNKIREYLEYRKKTQPLDLPSAGSIFKNPLRKPAGFSAGELIEKCGLKGKKIGNVKISEKHANFILNLGKGKARDIKKLINLAKQEVKNKFKINLEEEIELLGF